MIYIHFECIKAQTLSNAIDTNGTVQLPLTTFSEWYTPQAKDNQTKFKLNFDVLANLLNKSFLDLKYLFKET